MPTFTETLIITKLQSLYVKAVFSRTKKRVPQPRPGQAAEIAEWLGDLRLCELFIESQFWTMPEDFCLRTFNRPYPPANVCFGGEARDRYQKYLENGERVLVTREREHVKTGKKVGKKTGKKISKKVARRLTNGISAIDQIPGKKIAKKTGKKVSKKVSASLKPPKSDKETRFDAMATALKGIKPDKLHPDEQELITASEIQLPKGYLSPSAVDTWLRCPMQYKLRYIDNIKTPPAVALEEGSSHHFALETNNIHKIKHGEDLPVKTIIEAFTDDFKSRSKEIEDWEGDKPDNVYNRGATMLKFYAQHFAPTLLPVRSEGAFAVSIGPVPVVGFMDVVGFLMAGAKSKPNSNDKELVVDYKTVSRAKSKTEADNSLQLSAYGQAMMVEHGVKKAVAGFYNLNKKTGVGSWVPTNVTLKRVNWYRRVVLSVANQISLGNFPLTDPNNWGCSNRFCGQWNHCRGKYE